MSILKQNLPTTINGKEYVLVEKSEEPKSVQKDVKTDVPKSVFPLPDPSKLKQILSGRQGKGGAFGRGLKPIRTRLSYQFTNTAAAATAQTAVISVIPANGQDWGSFSTLYDEVICHGGEVHYDFEVTGTGTQSVGFNSIGAVAFDPVNGGAYGSVAAILEASQNHLGRFLSQSSQYGAGPLPLQHTNVVNTKTGMQFFKFKIPKNKSARATANSTVVSGEYSATIDAADIYGYIKCYVPAPAANNSITFFGWLVMDCTFRSRS